jgi:predicted transcriptional regulator
MPRNTETLLAPKAEFRDLIANLGMPLVAFCREAGVPRSTAEEMLRYQRTRRYTAAKIAATYARLVGVSQDEAMNKLFEQRPPHAPSQTTSA